jgi:predicted RNA methylase
VTETASNKTLLGQIQVADVVVGCASMAMVVALLAKKRVVCSIPPGGKACQLPQAEIEHLQVLISTRQGVFLGA